MPIEPLGSIVMKVDKKSKHECKFCSKVFRCGRSLGGHMRSHLINISSTEKKLPPLPLLKEAECKRKRPTSDQEEVALTLILLSMDSPLQSQSKESCRFRCMICNKAFPSYQALGGHRASHKKFKGCCAPTKLPPNLEECKKSSKDHECPVCFKIFPSGQALGGHKRSHLITDHPKNASDEDDDDHLRVQRQIPQVRHFLDLNLPAPLEEDCAELKPWLIGAAHEPRLGLLSTS